MSGAWRSESDVVGPSEVRSRTIVPLSVTTALLVVASIAMLALPHISRGRTDLFFTAPVQIVLGSSIVMLLFLFVSIGFRRMGIHANDQALGLPEGSIRALIAVILIVIFFILANIIFGVLQGPDRRTPFSRIPRALVEAQTDERTVAIITARDTVVEGGTTIELLTGEYLQSPTNASAERVGLQLLTALITLVTAISAFYFGSNSVRAAASAVTRTLGGEAPGAAGALNVIEPSGSPAELVKADGEWQAVQIGFDVTGVELVNLVGDASGVVAWNEAKKRFVYRPGEPEAEVTIRFALRGEPNVGAEVKLRRSATA